MHGTREDSADDQDEDTETAISMIAPETSTTLLRDIAADTQHIRWTEFYDRYRPLMQEYMSNRFPNLNADEAIQDTLIALTKVLPDYRYVPGEKGAFHNYLIGILKRKALLMIQAESRRSEQERQYAEKREFPTSEQDPGEQIWRESLMEIALQQLLADESVHGRTKQVFKRIAVNGEKPEDVARSFGITRNAVDQMKNRMVAKLRTIVAELEKVR